MLSCFINVRTEYFSTRCATREGPILILANYPRTSTCYGIQGGKYAARLGRKRLLSDLEVCPHQNATIGRGNLAFCIADFVEFEK